MYYYYHRVTREAYSKHFSHDRENPTNVRPDIMMRTSIDEKCNSPIDPFPIAASIHHQHTLRISFYLTNGTPEGTLLAYSSYSGPKNCLRKNSSYGILLAKKFQTMIVNPSVERGLHNITCVPTDQMKNPQYPGCRTTA